MSIDKNKLSKVAEFLRDAFIHEFQQAYKERGVRLSQADLAAEWGVDPTGLSNWMNGKRAMSVENVIQVSRYVGPGIFGVNNLPIMIEDPFLHRVAAGLMNADEETKQRVLELINSDK